MKQGCRILNGSRTGLILLSGNFKQSGNDFKAKVGLRYGRKFNTME